MGPLALRGKSETMDPTDIEAAATEAEQLTFQRFRYDPEAPHPEFMLELPPESNPVPPLHIWGVPVYTPYVHSQLTDDMIRGAEEKLGVTLPQVLLDLLKQQNGGYLRKTHCITFE